MTSLVATTSFLARTMCLCNVHALPSHQFMQYSQAAKISSFSLISRLHQHIFNFRFLQWVCLICAVIVNTINLLNIGKNILNSNNFQRGVRMSSQNYFQKIQKDSCLICIKVTYETQDRHIPPYWYLKNNIKGTYNAFLFRSFPYSQRIRSWSVCEEQLIFILFVNTILSMFQRVAGIFQEAMLSPGWKYYAHP